MYFLPATLISLIKNAANLSKKSYLAQKENTFKITTKPFFARKFDFDKSPELLNLLNQRLGPAINLN